MSPSKSLKTTNEGFAIKYGEKEVIKIPDDSPRITKGGKISKATIHKGRFNYTVKTTLCGMEKIEKHIQIRVAIKKYLKADKDRVNYTRARQNLEFLSLTGNKHPNFVRYFDHAINNDFIYLVTELCICSVADLVESAEPTNQQVEFEVWRTRQINRTITPPPKIIHTIESIYDNHPNKINAQGILDKICRKDILKQSTEAVNYLHGIGLIHRNLHPDNFLIAAKDSDEFVVKLTDFQLAKDFRHSPTHSGSYTWSDWTLVPEMKGNNSDNDEEIVQVQDSKWDIFILGCYFYYVLTGGYHPFEDEITKITDENSAPFSSAWEGNDFWCKVEPRDDPAITLDLIRTMIRFKPSDRISAWQVLENEYFRPGSGESYELYGTDGKEPGLCVIVSQETFHNPECDAIELENDCAQLWRTFRRLGYQVVIFKNLKADQMVEFLTPDNLESRISNALENYASLVVCILSHGGKGVVEGVDKDGKGNNNPVLIDALRYPFSSGGCEALKGKPKIFVVLACQGINEQRVHASGESGANKSYRITNDHVYNFKLKHRMQMIPSNGDFQSPMEDFLTLFSTIENFLTYYIPGVGSPFIKHLCSALMSEYNNDEKTKLTFEDEKNKKDLVSLFHSFVVPKVGQDIFREVIHKSITAKQTPELRSTLKKTIRFRATVATYDIAKESKDLKPIYDGKIDDPTPFEKGRKTYYKKLYAKLKKMQQHP